MFLKVLNSDLVHHGFQYKEGLNIDTNNKGLHFTTEDNIYQYFGLGSLIADVNVPPKTKIEGPEWSMYADQIILSNFRSVKSYINSLPYFKQLELIQKRGSLIWYIDNQTEELCLTAIEHGCEMTISFIHNPSPVYCIQAIDKNNNAERYIPEKIKLNISNLIKS